jgi:branched-chain amino acid transport system permease protein
VIERFMLRKLYHLDHLYGLLLTFGLALVIEGMFRNQYGVSGQPYREPAPRRLQSRLHVPAEVSRLRSSSPRSSSASAPGSSSSARSSAPICAPPSSAPISCRPSASTFPLMITLTYGFGVALAGFAGVLAAPIYQVSPMMGANLIIVVFAVVVIGGMGSILGAIITGYMLGIIEGLTRVFYPEASSTVIFVIMAIVLLIRPQGLFGTAK